VQRERKHARRVAHATEQRIAREHARALRDEQETLRRRAQSIARELTHVPTEHVCPACGTTFIAKYGDRSRVFCSRVCGLRMRKTLRRIRLGAFPLDERNELAALFADVKRARQLIDHAYKSA